MIEKEFQSGDLILEKGEISSFLFLIKHGRVKLDDGRRSFFLSEDDFFGEDGCFLGKPSAFSAAACEGTSLGLLESEEAEKLLSGNGEKAFSLFVRNAARMSDDTPPVVPLSPEHMRLAEGILPYVVEKNGDDVSFEAEIDLETLAAQLGMKEEKLLDLFAFSRSFGYVAYEDGKVLSCGKTRLMKLFKDYSREKVFAGVKGQKGLGRISFLNVVNEKTKI